MSAKRKKRAPKSGAVWRMSAKEATLAKKPRYNGYVCGHGAHGDAKYSRTKSKRAWQKQLKQEGAPRGSFLSHLVLPRLLGASSVASRERLLDDGVHGGGVVGIGVVGRPFYPPDRQARAR